MSRRTLVLLVRPRILLLRRGPRVPTDLKNTETRPAPDLIGTRRTIQFNPLHLYAGSRVDRRVRRPGRQPGMRPLGMPRNGVKGVSPGLCAAVDPLAAADFGGSMAARSLCCSRLFIYSRHELPSLLTGVMPYRESQQDYPSKALRT
jgi:hypothetical protein